MKRTSIKTKSIPRATFETKLRLKGTIMDIRYTKKNIVIECKSSFFENLFNPAQNEKIELSEKELQEKLGIDGTIKEVVLLQNKVLPNMDKISVTYEEVKEDE